MSAPYILAPGDFDPASPVYDARGQPIFDYFEDKYIGRPRRRGPRHPPMFSIDMWNVHDRVLTDAAKSNNSCEGWHHAFQNGVGACYPNLWRLIEALKKEQALVHNTMTDVGGCLKQWKDSPLLSCSSVDVFRDKLFSSLATGHYGFCGRTWDDAFRF
ncbi:hypothetical protein ACOMHN_027970 [Nucella lapillus]